MSCQINGHHYSYDYEDIIADLQKDLAEGDVALDDEIDLVRAIDSKYEIAGYKPIVNYYIKGDFEQMMTPIDTIFNRDEFSDEEWHELEDFRQNALEEYQLSKPFFTKATVKDTLDEMEKWNQIV